MSSPGNRIDQIKGTLRSLDTITAQNDKYIIHFVREKMKVDLKNGTPNFNS